jgi:trimeric autotransporter adhesin
MKAGDAYTVAGKGNFGFSPNGSPAASARLAGPGGVAVDGAGNLVIADTYNNRVRVVATSSATFYGRPMTAGDIYTVAGDNAQGFSGDGGRATRARLYWPQDATVDGAGNLVIADTNDYRVRVVAESAGTFYGQAMKAGHIYTVAGNGMAGFSGDGGPATSARLHSPNGVAVDPGGNLLIADSVNNRVRVVAATSGTFYGVAMTAGDIYTVAGNGMAGFSGDGGPATSARVFFPSGVAPDAGNLVISDGSGRVRMVTG